MTTIDSLYNMHFSDLRIGQVVYQVQTDVLFIIIGLRGSFPCSESVRDDELDLLSETGKVSNIFHLWGEHFQLLDAIIPDEQRTNYQEYLKTVRQTL